MNEKDINIQDERLRRMLKPTKKQASPNLKYRIMRQIETESTLTRKKTAMVPKQRNVLKDFITIFGIMYGVLAVMAGGAYLLQGKEFMLSPRFLWTVVLVAFIFSAFWLITRLDVYLKEKQRKRPHTSKK